MLPTLLNGLHSNFGESAKHAASLFNLFLKLLHSMILPGRGTKDDAQLRDRFGFSDEPEDATFVATWIGRLILYSPTQASSMRCPGLSVGDCNFLQLYGKDDTWTPGTPGGMRLAETKVVAARFVASGAFSDSERFLPALFASADSNSRISEVGDDMLKRATSAIDLEDPVFVKNLYTIYLGTRGTDGSLSVRPHLQTKILALLCRSKTASSFIAESAQIVQEGLSSRQATQVNGANQSFQKGLEASKLRGQIFAFTNWLARISSTSDIASFAPLLVEQLRNYVEDQGWPRPGTEEPLSTGELASRSYAYESIGLLASACPEKLLLSPQIELLRWLMTSLSEDPSGTEVSLSIENALSSVIGAFGGRLNDDLAGSLASLFLHHMDLYPTGGDEDSNGIIRSTRFVAIRFANRCLPYDNIDGRYIDVLSLCGMNAERSEVLEEGRKGLDPYWHRMLNPQIDMVGANTGLGSPSEIDFPSFEPLVERLLGSEASWDLSKAHLTSAYLTALGFCRCVLMHRALSAVGSTPVVDAEWERNIDALILNNEEARHKLVKYFQRHSQGKPDFCRALAVYLQACFRGLVVQIGGDTSRAGYFFLELCTFLPTSEYIRVARDVIKLQPSILSTNKGLREAASHVFGLVSSLEECPDGALRHIFKALDRRLDSWQQAIGGEVLEVHGAILAKVYFFTRSVRRGTLSSNLEEQLPAFIAIVFEILENGREKLLLEGAFVALTELSLYSMMELQTLSSSQVETLVHKLAEKSKDGSEKAISALGHFAMQCNEEDTESYALKNVIDRLYDLHNVRQPEVQFAVGEAFSCAAIGWKSKALMSVLDIDGPPPPSMPRKVTLSMLLDRVLADCKTTKPALRQATVIWLLCIIQFCGHQPEVQNRLKECQLAFKGFLADRESLNQESASRGLMLVYEKGDRVLKDELIRDLVGSFTGTGSSLAGTVSEDTELFDAGALPTGEGSITTYKDIMSLASEVGDSSLVYRFMSLASHDAIWSSRAAFGRFGLSSILSDASTEGYLAHNPKLYPALFRYRFDPNTNVRTAMNDIWSALVKDPNGTITQHFDAMIKDLFKSILGKEWRTRQASCAAIADLVQGRSLETYERYLNEIWSLAFKVCDDIKESVRAAAMSLARVLTGILTRSLEAGDSSARYAERMLKQVLPFLLSTQGLESGAPEVQDFSRKTILQIIKKSSAKTLRPFVPELVGRLLALLSSIEPEMINYLHMNAETFGVTKQELDDARLKHIRGSTMLEAIEKCLDYLDESAMPELQKHLDDAIKTVIGLPSKVGCSRVLVSLSTRQNFIFKRYADHFLPLARKQVFDRNDTISSAYASACGYLARLANDEVLLKLIHDCRKLYFDSEEDRQRMIAGDIVYAFSKYATDRFNSLAGEVLPFVFVAKHDQHDRAQSLFEDTWNENVGGSRAVLLYLKEIIQLATQYLDSARWSVKHTSAYTVADVTTSAGTNISDADANVIWPALEKALSGKTWEGKEKVLKAFVQFAKNSNLLGKDPKIAEQMEKIMLRESRRNNVAYRQHALGCLADFINLRASVDMYEQVYAIAEPVIQELSSDTEDMDIDSVSGGPSSKTVKELTITNALTSLFHSILPQGRRPDQTIPRLNQSYGLLDKVRKSESGSRSIQVAIFDSLTSLFRKLQGNDDIPAPPNPLYEETLVKYTTYLFSAGDQVESIRIKAAEAANALAPLARRNERLKGMSKGELEKAKAQERSSAVLQIWERVWKALLEE